MIEKNISTFECRLPAFESDTIQLIVEIVKDRQVRLESVLPRQLPWFACLPNHISPMPLLPGDADLQEGQLLQCPTQLSDRRTCLLDCLCASSQKNKLKLLQQSFFKLNFDFQVDLKIKSILSKIRFHKIHFGKIWKI